MTWRPGRSAIRETLRTLQAAVRCSVRAGTDGRKGRKREAKKDQRGPCQLSATQRERQSSSASARTHMALALNGDDLAAALVMTGLASSGGPRPPWPSRDAQP